MVGKVGASLVGMPPHISNTTGTAVRTMTGIPALILVHTAVRTGIRGMVSITASILAPMKEVIMIFTVVLTATGTMINGTYLGGR